ncbi:MAG: PRC-barrel domain-containing protein [Rhodospirillaceae bacterium]
MKIHALLLGAISVAALAACANNDRSSPEMARAEPRPAPITSPTARELPPRETARVTPAPATTPTVRPAVTGPMPGEMNLAGFIGRDVKNAKGETIGEIDEVLLDGSGRVDAVIVTVGGFMGLGGRDVALKWSDLRLNNGGRDVVVDMTEMQLQQMPEYRANPSGTVTTRGAAPDRK